MIITRKVVEIPEPRLYGSGEDSCSRCSPGLQREFGSSVILAVQQKENSFGDRRGGGVRVRDRGSFRHPYIIQSCSIVCSHEACRRYVADEMLPVFSKHLPQ